MKKLLSITVQGKTGKFTFNFYGNPKYIDLWRKEGFVIHEIENSIPG